MLRGLTKASVFFLDTLSQHDSESLQYVAGRLVPLLEGRPRPQQFPSEREFAHALRRWSDKVRTLRVEMDSIPESERQDEFENWWDRASDLVGILEGRGSVLIRVCADLGADWKEVCAAWGVFVEPRLKRQALPYVRFI
jgi:nuclear pore complex protein Nup85